MSVAVKTLTTPTGANLALYTFDGPKNPKGIVQINHGLAEHAGRYERFATALAMAGYQAIAHDHRGHGKTTTHEGPHQGQFATKDGFECVISDVFAVNVAIQDAYPDRPIIYFGHSMGGIIGINYLHRHSDTLAAAALWNFNVDGGPLVSVLKMLLKAERMFKGSDVPSSVATKLTFADWNKKFKPNRTEFDWLSRDDAEVDKYVADPLCGFPASNGLWLDLISGIQDGANDQKLGQIRKDLPIHLVGGTSDPSTINSNSLQNLHERLKKAGNSEVALELYKDARHETLNEINREEAVAKFVNWLNAKFG